MGMQESPSCHNMGETGRVVPSEYDSEQKTQPFSQSEIEARLQRNSIRDSNEKVVIDPTIHLDELVIPQDKDIRILVRPLRSRSVSPGNRDNCEWLALHAEVAAPADQRQSRVLAVTQTSRDIKFSVRVPGDRYPDGSPKPPLWCELYYDPASDNQILVNRTDIPIALSRISLTADSVVQHTVNPFTHKALSPGTWRICVDDIEVLDFRILERRPAMLRLTSMSSDSSIISGALNSSGKRSFVADDDDTLGPQPRKHRASDAVPAKDDGVIMFLQPKDDPLVFPLPTAAKGKEVAHTGAHALLDLQDAETVQIPGGCEIDSYQLTRREAIAASTLSAVFTGDTDRANVPPDSIITVKVLKTRTNAVGAAVRPHETERNVIRQADIWLREFQSHEYLQHDSIVRLYGGDARYLSLYMEHVDARDLSAKGQWRAHNSECFIGTRHDAVRILRDIAGALHYIHGRKLVHNDIKPANILYSRERGAVLCDFGLSTHTGNAGTTGGTPYYIPPEFIALKQRGPPSDVWALGVTMLYVLRKIAYPESRARRQHPKPLFWYIMDLNKPHGLPQNGAQTTGPPAIVQMRTWLSEVTEARDKLDPQDKLERLVAEMLTPNPNQRITMRKVISELFSEPAS